MTTGDNPYAHICRGILERLHEYLNRRDLTPDDEEEIRRHLKACPPCGDRYEFEEALLGRLRASDPCACPDRLRERVKSLLDQA